MSPKPQTLTGEEARSYLRLFTEELRLEPVTIDKHTVLASSAMWLESGDLDPGHLTVPLSNDVPFIPGVQLNLMPVTMEDFGGVPYNWRAIVIELYRRITDGAQAHIFCHGGQGRTGTMLASLIAIGESAQSTPDPIAAVRRRYCGSAVETLAQGQAIFALRNQLLPKRYINELMLPPGAYRTRLARRTTSSA